MAAAVAERENGAAAPGDATPDDLMALLASIVRHHGLAGYDTAMFDRFLEHGLPLIMTRLFHVKRVLRNPRSDTPEARRITSFRLEIRFRDVAVAPPTHGMFAVGRVVDTMPNRARTSTQSYSGALTMVVEVELAAVMDDNQVVTVSATTPRYRAMSMPIMVGSSACHTANLTAGARIGIREDPSDPGGYFIVGGQSACQEYNITAQDNSRFNSPHVHLQQARTEHAQVSFISQPGSAYENSSQIVLRYMRSGALTLSIASVRVQATLPLVLLYRLFGMTADSDAVDTVLAHGSSPQLEEILRRGLYVCDAAYAPFIYELDQGALATGVGAAVAEYVRRDVAFTSNTDAVRYLRQDLLGTLDAVVLPHMGKTAAARASKLRFVGELVHRMLITHLGALPPADRDSLIGKRAFTASILLAKLLKTELNKQLVSKIIKALRSDLENRAFSEITPARIVDVVRMQFLQGGPRLTLTVEKAIVSSARARERENNRYTGAPTSRAAQRQLPANRLERKCPMNTVSALRSVTASGIKTAKGSARALKMREIHGTYPCFYCTAKSADTGVGVGTNRELAAGSIICMAEAAAPLVALLLEHVEPLARVSARDGHGRALVYVNGEWIGFARRDGAEPECHRLAAHFRGLRRAGDPRVPRLTGVFCDYALNRVEFWTDAGRIAHPLLVVRNNLADDPSGGAFDQRIDFTHADARAVLAGRLSFADLLARGCMEYITPEEMENCLVAPDLETLARARGDPTRQYTHCCIPQAIISLTALTSPMLSCTQPVRVTYQTNQSRQTTGWPTLMTPYRVTPRTSQQHYVQHGVLSTFADNFVLPSGYNCVVAIMSMRGLNIEDSAAVNSASLQRGMHDVSFNTVYNVQRERNEQFCTPDPTVTCDMKPLERYSKLVDGCVPVGTVVHQGDIIIGRVVKILRGSGAAGAGAVEFQFRDRSVAHEGDSAVVDDVKRPQGINGEVTMLVRTRAHRRLVVGDKGSSRSGNKFIVAATIPQADMPYTESGITPDFVFNTHCMPSRMTVGQMIEAVFATAAAAGGFCVDGSAMRVPTVGSVSDMLRAAGLRDLGCHTMFDPRTGRPIAEAICIGITYIQRLQKYVVEDQYAVGPTCATDNTTGQPLSGKSANGGLRFGEMEYWALMVHGSMSLLQQKIGPDSDGCTIYVCRRCGGRAGVVVNRHLRQHMCADCGPFADIYELPCLRAANVMFNEINGANIDLRFGLKPLTVLPGPA